MNKMIVKYKAILILAVTLGIIMCQSCKQGCTNPKAFNYTQGAKQDDGSCLYCDSSSTSEITTNSYTYYDYTNGSIHYSQAVLNIYITENEMIYTGNGCKQLGLGNNNNTCNRLGFSAELHNETSSTMVLSGDLHISGNSQSSIHTFTSISIPPYSYVTANVGTICDNGFGFTSNLQNYTFQYH